MAKKKDFGGLIESSFQEGFVSEPEMPVIQDDTKEETLSTPEETQSEAPVAEEEKEPEQPSVEESINLIDLSAKHVESEPEAPVTEEPVNSDSNDEILSGYEDLLMSSSSNMIKSRKVDEPYVTKTIYITNEQYQSLLVMKFLTGQGLSEMLRNMLDEYIPEHVKVMARKKIEQSIKNRK